MAKPASPNPPALTDEPGEDAAQPAPAKRASPIVVIAAMVVLTALGVGCGGLLGLHLRERMEETLHAKAEIGEKLKSPYPASMGLRPLTPVVASLSSPERTWVRLEASLVMDDDQSNEAKMLSAQITEDIVAFLRTVPLSHLQGASGFQHLREDLNDRVRIRSGGKVRDLIIQALIIE